MPVTASQTLFNEAQCFSCLGAVGAAQTMRMALLLQISDVLGSPMTTQELIDQGQCYLCLPGVSLADTVELALLNNISDEIGGGGSGGSGQLKIYPDPPDDVSKPGLAYPAGGGTLYQWDPDLGAYV